MISTFEDFVIYYNKYGKCPNQLSKPNHTFNEKELLSKWKSYSKAKVKSSQKKQKGVTGDSLWDEVVAVVDKRDNYQCRFLSKLKIDNFEAYMYIISTCPYNLIKTIDHAHIIPRSNSKNLYYDSNNLVCLSRVIHSRLDQYLDPVYGKAINREQVKDWWIYIIGEEQYENLLERK